MINYWAVLVSIIASIVIGSIWWGPLFGKLWTQHLGWDKNTPKQQAELKKTMGGAYVQQIILSFLEAVILAYLFNRIGVDTAAEGLKYACVIWLGFIFPLEYGKHIWGNRNYKFIFASFGNTLLTIIVMGLIIGGWR